MSEAAGTGDAAEEPITAFDAAAYVYQLTDELARLTRGRGLKELAKMLEQARDRSVYDMIELGGATPRR